MASIDINADLGEGVMHQGVSVDTLLMPYVSSASIACGGHAGDEAGVMARKTGTQKLYSHFLSLDFFRPDFPTTGNQGVITEIASMSLYLAQNPTFSRSQAPGAAGSGGL